MIYKVWYTDRFVPDRFGGKSYGPLIFIRPKYRGDRGLLEHEKQHARQWYRGLGIIYALRYHFSKKWRLKYEVEGYKVQLKYSPGNANLFAWYIATKYNLSVTQQEAFWLITEGNQGVRYGR